MQWNDSIDRTNRWRELPFMSDIGQQGSHVIGRALRLGSTAFLVLVGLGALVMAGVFWHHRTTANQSSITGAEQVHTDVIFVFASSPPTLAAFAAIIWLVCVGVSYFRLASRRQHFFASARCAHGALNSANRRAGSRCSHGRCCELAC